MSKSATTTGQIAPRNMPDGKCYSCGSSGDFHWRRCDRVTMSRLRVALTECEAELREAGLWKEQYRAFAADYKQVGPWDS